MFLQWVIDPERAGSVPFGNVSQGLARMSGKTVTRADLTEAVYRAVGVSRNESSGFVERILEEMSLALERDEQVKVSSFGTFSVRRKQMRMGRNPKTGEEVPITPRRVITFRPSHVLKDAINDGHRTRQSLQSGTSLSSSAGGEAPVSYAATGTPSD